MTEKDSSSEWDFGASRPAHWANDTTDSMVIEVSVDKKDFISNLW